MNKKRRRSFRFEVELNPAQKIWIRASLLQSKNVGSEIRLALQIYKSFEDLLAKVQLGSNHYLAVPDLHGRLDLFEKCIDQIKSIKAHVVFLGDYIDRLPSLKLVNRILEVEAARPDYVFLPGNHEWMALEWYLENEQKIKAGRWELISAPEATLMKEWKENRAVPKAQLRFFDRILRKRYHMSQQGHLLFVHAGVEKSLRAKSLESMDPDHFLWSRKMPEAYQGPLLIHGHTFAGEAPLIRKNEVNLETRCWMDQKRPLTIGIFEDTADANQQILGTIHIAG